MTNDESMTNDPMTNDGGRSVRKPPPGAPISKAMGMACRSVAFGGASRPVGRISATRWA